MTRVVRATRRELTSTDVMDVVERGGRVLIEVSVLGKTMEVVIREQNGTYYCDTPMKLLRHETGEELRRCLEQFRLARPATEVDVEDGEVTTVDA